MAINLDIVRERYTLVNKSAVASSSKKYTLNSKNLKIALKSM